jgi:hypothetical protein
MTDTERETLGLVLDELEFPAERWEIVTLADWYGASAGLCERLRHLPPRTTPYRNIAAVSDALDSVPEPRSEQAP